MGVAGVLMFAAVLSVALSHAVNWFAQHQFKTALQKDGQQTTPVQSIATQLPVMDDTETRARDLSVKGKPTVETKQSEARSVSSPLVRSLTTAESQTNEIYVAGSDPSQRPPHAPSIKKTVKDGEWYARALTGVKPPYPPSMKFLDDQGAWYTPFNRRGMTGPYDIRSWHDPFN